MHETYISRGFCTHGDPVSKKNYFKKLDVFPLLKTQLDKSGENGEKCSECSKSIFCSLETQFQYKNILNEHLKETS